MEHVVLCPIREIRAIRGPAPTSWESQRRPKANCPAANR